METKQATLVILSPGFPENEADSTCLPFVQNVVKALNAQFPLVKIAVLAFDYPYVSATYQWNSNEVMSFNGLKKRKIKKLFKWMFIWQKLNELKRKNNIIGVLSFWCGECAYMGNRYAKKKDLKHYCWIMGQDAKKYNKYVSRIHATGNSFIALSDFISDEFYNNYAIRPAQTIPIGIDAKEFTAGSSQRNIDILAVGSLIPLKRYDIFISVMAELQKDIPQIRAVLCGDGPEKDKLQDLINSLSLQQNIFLAGEKPHEEILDMMQQSKVFLHPSAYEGFGIVCLEALQAGCDVISFIRPMKRDIEQWHIVHSKEEMKEKALGLLKGPTTTYKSVTPFPIDETVKKLMELFSD